MSRVGMLAAFVKIAEKTSGPGVDPAGGRSTRL
jgi:hypothetical protein